MSTESQSPQYRLHVTAGPSYDPKSHQTVPVNQDTPLHIESDQAVVDLCVRIQDYKGYPENSPTSNAYFKHPAHENDAYSISFSIVFKHPVDGNALLFGNDFDHPVRDRLPPGFGAGLRLVKWAIDPSLDGDAYADKPYLYSPALATWNQLLIGGLRTKHDNNTSSSNPEKPTARIVEEGAEDDGVPVRRGLFIPDTASERRRFFQDEPVRKEFVFQPGRAYWVDFGNPYLGFDDFTLRLPGITLNGLPYIDEVNNYLRYVLKDRDTGVVYLVVVFTMVKQGDGGDAKDGDSGDDDDDEAKKRFDWEPDPSLDDVE
ncbi:DUF1769-domain-containing protein [Aspergillus campestris IBT 28561]|uniref:DUF1769-domain-containing protein n=1 Tax=Aspergillus campestris (strain IBT 28561) TaxID=1392248 RepID=A0A2I1D439_ASPC2|nr:DUF1769-domain-containing protein [Aspergillus campestris IBT 28561]PKY04635.1 DUF1769-domain-containing protein [Aspergillus campestris IBT 28561]